MKKLIVLFLFVFCVHALYSETTILRRVVYKPTRGVTMMIEAEEINNTIQFDSDAYLTGSEVQLVDENGNIVLSEYIITNSSMINYIDITGLEYGTYTINLYKDNTEYTGEIEING